MLISVIMPTFNESPEMVSNAIRSILEQTVSDFELHIFDDSTSEDTKKAIDSFKGDNRVNIHRRDKRLGFIKSLNEGLRASKGKYIARMDGDDYSFPDRFEKEIAYLEAHPKVLVVGGQMNIMNQKGEITSSRSYPTGAFKLYLFSCARNPLAHPTIMMRRDVLDMGYCYDETLKMSEDLDLWLRLMNDGHTIANLPDTVLNFRVMDNFLEKRSSDVQREVMSQVRRKNFDMRHPLHSFLSILSAWLFTHIPRKAINMAYQTENKV